MQQLKMRGNESTLNLHWKYNVSMKSATFAPNIQQLKVSRLESTLQDKVSVNNITYAQFKSTFIKDATIKSVRISICIETILKG